MIVLVYPVVMMGRAQMRWMATAVIVSQDSPDNIAKQVYSTLLMPILLWQQRYTCTMQREVQGGMENRELNVLCFPVSNALSLIHTARDWDWDWDWNWDWDQEWRVSILCSLLYTLHRDRGRDRELLFSIVRVWSLSLSLFRSRAVCISHILGHLTFEETNSHYYVITTHTSQQ